MSYEHRRLLLMQLSILDLTGNQLEGILPESWSNLTKVSHRYRSVYLLVDCTSYFVHKHICS